MTNVTHHHPKEMASAILETPVDNLRRKQCSFSVFQEGIPQCFQVPFQRQLVRQLVRQMKRVFYKLIWCFINN